MWSIGLELFFVDFHKREVVFWFVLVLCVFGQRKGYYPFGGNWRVFFFGVVMDGMVFGCFSLRVE